MGTSRTYSIAQKYLVGSLAFGLFVGAPSALADIEGPAITVYAIETADPNNWDSVTFSATLDTDGTWRWQSDTTYEFQGGTLGALNPQSEQGPTWSSAVYYQDPMVNLNFSVAAGPLPTTFMIGAALLTFPAINEAAGRASVGMSVTDVFGDGGTLNGSWGDSGTSAYRAAINGVAGPLPGAPQFAEMIQTVVAPPLSTGTANAAVPAVGYSPIGVPVSSMSSYIWFTL
ncbi:MAG: hypothetical protein HZB38_09250, partial [Planctomycetes bacterium]|nr:hypothetical protein [Planctomycetota bacterium]